MNTNTSINKTKNILNFKNVILPLIIILAITFADQFSKYLIVHNFSLYDSKPLIKNVLSLTYIRNEGMAWGMFQGKRVIFLIMTIIILSVSIYIYFNCIKADNYKAFRICIILLTGGSIGNMIDRLKLGYVIDFFEVKFINFPVFNVADIFVTISMILIIILIIFVYKEKDFDNIFKFGNSKKDDKEE